MAKEKNILVIPRHLVFLRFVDIPSTDDSEIRNMVGFQAVKDIPYPRQEMVVGYRNLGSYRPGFSSIMLAVANKATVQDVASGRGHVDDVRLHTELLYLSLLKKGVLAQDRVNFLIYIGEKDSEIMVIDKDRPIFSRGFKNSERFLEEIDRSVLAYEKAKATPAIENIVVTYPSSVDLQEARPHIERHFTIPASFCEYTDDLAAAGLPAKISLLPGEISDKRMRSEKRKANLVTYSLIAFVVILSFAALSFKIYEKKRFLGVFSPRVVRMQSEIERLNKFIKRTDVARERTEEGLFIVEMLRRFYDLIPADISISGLDYNGKGDMFYKGTSKDMPSTLAFVKTLEGLKYFKSAEVEYATKKKVKGEDFIDFNIHCRLNTGEGL